MKSGKIGQVVSEKKFKDYMIVNMYIAKGQGSIIRRHNFVLTKSITTLIIHCKFQPLVFNTFSDNDFSKFSIHKSMGIQI